MATGSPGCGHYYPIGHDVCAIAVVGGCRVYQCGNTCRTVCDLAHGVQAAPELARDDEVCHFGVPTVETSPLSWHFKDH